MNININKKYRTRAGQRVEIYKIVGDDQPNKFPVIGSVIDKDGKYTAISWTKEGEYDLLLPGPHDLIEVSTYIDLKIDDKVICWNDTHPEDRRNRYFAGVDDAGRPTAFIDGTTSWSNFERTSVAWDHCEKVED